MAYKRLNMQPHEGVFFKDRCSRCGGALPTLWHAAEALLLHHSTALVASSCLRPLLSRLISAFVERRAQRTIVEPRSQRIDDEESAVSLSLLLRVAPQQLLVPVLRFFAVALPPYGRRLFVHLPEHAEHVLPDGRSIHGVTLLMCLFASLRLLQCSHEFARLWRWEPVLELASHTDPFVRWCVAYIAAELLGVDVPSALAGVHPALSLSDDIHYSWPWRESEAAVQNERSVSAVELLVDGNENCPVNEGAEEGAEDVAADTFPISTFTMEFPDFSADEEQLYEPPGQKSVCGFDLPCRAKTSAPNKNSAVSQNTPKFAWVPSTWRSMSRFAAALCRNKPVLLEGSLGCGKSALAKEMAHLTGHSDMLTLNLDDQMDSKSILGGYVCGNGPGDFRWQPGVLTNAVLKGRWLLIEDIDVASGEIHSLLAPLLQSNKLYIAERGETINAARGFQLLATCVPGRTNALREFSTALWAKVHCEDPTPSESEEMLCECYPLNRNVAHRMVQSLLLLQHANGTLPSKNRSYLEHNRLMPSLPKGRMRRPFTMRELNKWANRLMQLHSDELRSCEPDTHLSDRMVRVCFEEGCSVLTSAVPSFEGYRDLLECLGRVWSINADQLDAYVNRSPQVQRSGAMVRIGSSMCKLQEAEISSRNRPSSSSVSSTSWCNTSHSARMLEHLNQCVQFEEPVLLVGETGAGKTALVQQIASLHNTRLTVVNMSQQSDMADIMGGFKPVSPRVLCNPLNRRFRNLFTNTFSPEANAEFLTTISRFVEKGKWARLLFALSKACERVQALYSSVKQENDNSVEVVSSSQTKRNKRISAALECKWRNLHADISAAQAQLEGREGDDSPVFSFVEGALVQALRNGEWILLDEINLAPAETLQRLESILDGESIVLSERGDSEPIARDSSFRLFACMNPPTDVGKRDLQNSIKARMTEIFVEEPSSSTDLEQLTRACLHGIREPPVQSIVSFFQEAKAAARTTLLDSAGKAPEYNLRSLVRALGYARAMSPIYGLRRALYDGISMTFLTLLHQDSLETMGKIVQRHILCSISSNELNKVPPQPKNGEYVLFQNFWVEAGPHSEPEEDQRFVLTESVKEYLRHLARAVVIRRHPILLQGPTGSGKTTLVEYLARRTGHKYVRINNHEHTDVAEYIGTYVNNEYGQLEFKVRMKFFLFISGTISHYALRACPQTPKCRKVLLCKPFVMAIGLSLMNLILHRRMC